MRRAIADDAMACCPETFPQGLKPGDSIDLERHD